MSINGIVTSALSTLQANSAALNVVSNNVANINTPNYARRTVDFEAMSSGGELSGVDIAEIQRVIDQYLNQETLTASGTSSQYDAQSTAFQQLNGLLGQPGDSTSLTAQLTNVFSALGQASLSPTASASQLGVVNAMQNFASTVSNLSGSITSLQGQVDQQIAGSMSQANTLIAQIYNLNNQIQTADAAGDTASALLDQRDTAIQSLSQMIGIRTIQQPNGSLAVMTQDGVNLVGDTYAQLSYSGGSVNGTYGPITIQQLNPISGQPIGPSQDLDPDLGSGSLKGLIDMRDNTLGQLQQELGRFAQQTALTFNAQSNQNVAYPPPSTLTGRNTGLLASDAINFTGQTTIGITDSNGNLVGQVAVDFDTGTLSVNGGPSVGFGGGTMGDLVSALNGALGSLGGSVSLTNGVLSIAAGGSNGVVVQDSTSNPSSRGGVGFSQFFGLNDIFQSAAPSIMNTGLSASDGSGLAAGGQINMSLVGPDGELAQQGSVTITAGMTIGDVVNALNTAMNGAATFTLNSNGSLTETPSAAYSGYQLNVTSDTTQRGTTGMSFTELFGLGVGQAEAQAQSFSLNSTISASPQLLPFAQPSTDISTASLGTQVVAHGDASGLLALQNLSSAQVGFPAVGALGAQSTTLSNYAGAFYQDVATRSDTAQSNQTAQDDRLQEAQQRQSSTSGVNLDEELSNMMTYQKAYSAGARMLSVADTLYDTLLQMQ